MPVVDLVQHPHIQIRHDTDGGWLYADWKGYQTVDPQVRSLARG